MNFLGITFKREYVLYNREANSETWFCDEPYASKEEMADRIKYLMVRNYRMRTRMRFTIEI